MNASNALFRSHLMQQFAAAARTQSRPPLALASENTRRQNVSSTRRTSSTTGGEQQQMDSSTSTLAFPNQTHSVTPTPSTKKTAFHSFASTSAASVKQDSHHTCTSRSEQESRVLHEDLEYKYEELNDNTKQHTHVQRQDNDASQSLMVNPLQSLIQSRFTAVNFGPMEPEKLRNALDRAIACALAAPNHHRTEPFFFKRLLAPSFSSHRLADVAARVVFAKKSKSDPLSAQAHADRKRNKWNQIPAFLVTLVANNQTPVVGDGVNIDDYTPLDFSPPETERQLEDVSFKIYVSN
jgi:hypothetical protein